MADLDTRFHETWLGMAQPVEGLVVSIPVLVEAQIMRRLPPEMQQRFLELCPPVGEARKGEAPERAIGDLSAFLAGLLDLTPDLFDAGDALPEELRLDVPEGRQTIRPTLALRRGWSDIPVPPYGTPVTEEEKRALEAFEDEVIDRLFVLNAQRAEEERRAALSASPEKKKPGRGRKAKAEGQMPLLP